MACQSAGRPGFGGLGLLRGSLQQGGVQFSQVCFHFPGKITHPGVIVRHQVQRIFLQHFLEVADGLLMLVKFLLHQSQDISSI